MIQLPNVEIISINTHDPIQSVKAIEYSCRGINFARKRLFTDVHMEVDGIEVINIPKFTTREAYSNFCIRDLHSYIGYEFVLIIHDDGFVINPELWTDEFFEYDYIGAPWPATPWNVKNRVGNGGFTLRSKRLLNLCSKLEYNGQHEDVMITNTYKEYFEQNGCKFPTVEIAAKFSLEHPIPEIEYTLDRCFGFHSKLTEQSRMYCEMIKNYEF